MLERALDELRSEGVDLIVAVGDIVDGHDEVDRCCQLLAERGVLCVRGNHERWLLKGSLRTLPQATSLETLSDTTRSFLLGLPATVALDTEGGKVLLCHGVGGNDMVAIRPDDEGYAIESNEELQELLRSREYDWMIHGHSHRPTDRQMGWLRIVNAGTLCREQSPCYVVIDLARGEVEFRPLAAP